MYRLRRKENSALYNQVLTERAHSSPFLTRPLITPTSAPVLALKPTHRGARQPGPAALVPVEIVHLAVLPRCSSRSSLGAKQDVHVLERPRLRLGVQEPDDGHADQVDGHEEEVDARADAVDADGPDLRHRDGADGAAGRGEVKAAGAEGGGEYLRGSRLVKPIGIVVV